AVVEFHTLAQVEDIHALLVGFPRFGQSRDWVEIPIPRQQRVIEELSTVPGRPGDSAKGDQVRWRCIQRPDDLSRGSCPGLRGLRGDVCELADGESTTKGGASGKRATCLERIAAGEPATGEIDQKPQVVVLFGHGC